MRHTCATPLAAKPSTDAGCQRRSMRGLRPTVRGCLLASTAGGGDDHLITQSCVRGRRLRCHHPPGRRGPGRTERRMDRIPPLYGTGNARCLPESHAARRGTE